MFECADHAWLQLGCLHGGFVQKAIDTLGIRKALGTFLEDPRFGDGVTIGDESIAAAVLDVMDGAFATASRADWLGRLDSGDVPAAPVLAGPDFLDDAQAAVNGLAAVDDDELGPLTEAGPFVRLSESRDAIGRGAPRLGTHTPPHQPSETRRASSNAVGAGVAGALVVELSNIIAGPMVGRASPPSAPTSSSSRARVGHLPPAGRP